MRRRLLAFLIFLSCNSLAAFAQNLITNPEFAGNLAGWNIYNHTQAVYDPTLNAPGSLGGSVKIINDVDESSNPACNANPTTICVTPFPIDQYVPVTPGVLYAFGGKVFIPSGQSASGAGEVAISFWDTNGKPINIGHLGSGNSVTSIGVWVSSDGTVQAPVGAVRVRLVPNNGRVGPTGSLQVNFDEMFFQPAATRLQVLIVPGILGTKLANNSEVVWMSNATLNSAALLGNPFNDLAYDTNGHPVDASLTTSAMTSTGDYGELFNLFSDTGVAAYALDCNTVLERINKTLTSLFGGASNCEKQINIYNSLASILSGGYAVQLFPYDWRRDIGDLSEDLFAKVQTMSGGSQVAIVAHSMGGLIVQEMMHRHAPALTNVLGPIITLGTPFLGSVDTYLYFQGWKDFLPWVVDGYTMSQIGKNWTSSYELLPRWNGFVQLGGQQIPYSQVYSGQSLPPWAYALPRQSALPIAYNLWAESPPTSLPNAYAIVGSGFATGLQINDNDETGCAELLHGNGDGTVPLISARKFLDLAKQCMVRE
jgi:pimeloyl-ACP methyl ester carboxylesterase